MEQCWVLISFDIFNDDASVLSVHKTKESAQLRQMLLSKEEEYNKELDGSVAQLGIHQRPYFL